MKPKKAKYFPWRRTTNHLLPNVMVQVLLVAYFTSGIRGIKGDYAPDADALSQSIQGMLDEGFSNQDIIRTLKLEVGIGRITALIDKLGAGQSLTVDETDQMQSGEINENDKKLVLEVLQKFGITPNQTDSNNATLEITTDDSTTKIDASLHGMNNGDDASAEEAEMNDGSQRNIDEQLEELAAKFMGSSSSSDSSDKPVFKPDYAYSPYDLIHLAKAEETIYTALKKYIKKMEAKLKVLQSYVNDYSDTSGVVSRSLDSSADVQQRTKAIVSNPLTSYKMIRRFVFKLPDVWASLGDEIEEELWKDLAKVQMKNQAPDKKDWKDSIETLFRIQYYNGYDAKQFANGELGSIKPKIKLTAEECMEIGLRALGLKFHDFALEWLYLALNKQAEKEDTSEVDLKFLEQSLDFAITEHNKAWESQPKIVPHAHVFSKKVLNPGYIAYATKQASVIRELAREFRDQEDYNFNVPYNFVSLCAGENLQSELEKSRLHCWLEREFHPYFYINPIKIELLSEDPYLIQIYEVIGNALVEDAKNRSILQLERSEVINYDDPQLNDVSRVRTSSQTWLAPDDLRGASGYQNLHKLMEKITGLVVSKLGSSEDLQIACYGTSHHYDEHLDAVQDERRTSDTGDRIATFMLYLSTVEEGGLTAFPVVGTAAKPIQGSAVFWYNLRKNGKPDKRTWHGGCPVVHGIKWVMNKWILLNENFRTRPCGLNKKD